MDDAVLALIADINKKHPGALVLGSEITQPVLDRIPSPALSIDVALGGGWVTNHWIEVVGHESAGKSLLVLKTIAQNQRRDPNWTVLWVATEDFVDSYAQMMGCDLDRIIIHTSNLMEEVYDAIQRFIENRIVDCVVIDSLPMLIPQRMYDGDYEDFQPGLSAFLTGKFFSQTNARIKGGLTEATRPVVGFAINQWREKIGVLRGDPRTTPGGKAKNFVFFQRVEVIRSEWINNTKGHHIGQRMKMRAIKNKTAPPGREAEIDVYVADGNGFKAGDIDTAKDFAAAGEAYGVIVRGGSNFSFGEHKWKGREAMYSALQTDVQLRSSLRDEVLRATTKVELEATNGAVKKAAKKK